jgi:hypothetical protein
VPPSHRVVIPGKCRDIIAEHSSMKRPGATTDWESTDFTPSKGQSVPDIDALLRRRWVVAGSSPGENTPSAGSRGVNAAAGVNGRCFGFRR